MSWIPEITDPQPGDSITQSIMWPLVYTPLLFILIVHVMVRVGWFLGWS